MSLTNTISFLVMSYPTAYRTSCQSLIHARNRVFLNFTVSSKKYAGHFSIGTLIRGIRESLGDSRAKCLLWSCNGL